MSNEIKTRKMLPQKVKDLLKKYYSKTIKGYLFNYWSLASKAFTISYAKKTLLKLVKCAIQYKVYRT